MKNLKVLVAVCVLVISTSIFSKQSALTLTTKSYKEVYEINKKGEKEIKYIAAGNVLPGDVVMYKNSINNNSDKAAKNMVLNNPIPEHTRYIEGSASCKDKCKISYSIDGGQVYDIASKLMIKDGDSMRLARADEYTHVRWVLTEPLAQDSTTIVSFKTKLQ